MAMEAVGRRRGLGGDRSAPAVQGNRRHHGRQGEAQYGVAVDMLTRAAIKEMMVPSLLPVWFRSWSAWDSAGLAHTAGAQALGGVLMGTSSPFSSSRSP